MDKTFSAQQDLLGEWEASIVQEVRELQCYKGEPLNRALSEGLLSVKPGANIVQL